MRHFERSVGYRTSSPIGFNPQKLVSKHCRLAGPGVSVFIWELFGRSGCHGRREHFGKPFSCITLSITLMACIFTHDTHHFHRISTSPSSSFILSIITERMYPSRLRATSLTSSYPSHVCTPCSDAASISVGCSRRLNWAASSSELPTASVCRIVAQSRSNVIINVTTWGGISKDVYVPRPWTPDRYSDSRSYYHRIDIEKKSVKSRGINLE